MKQGLHAFVPSRLFIYYNERALLGPQYTQFDSGAYLRDGIKSVSQQGDCPETEWPYSDANPGAFQTAPRPQCYTDALKYKAVQYQRLDADVNQMKGCLAGGYPFVFGIAVYNSFMSPQTTKTGDIPVPGDDENGPGVNGQPTGHALCAVGYDEARQLFLIRNSWGTGWGALGYGTIPYAYLLSSDLSDDFWTIRVVNG